MNWETAAVERVKTLDTLKETEKLKFRIPENTKTVLISVKLETHSEGDPKYETEFEVS